VTTYEHTLAMPAASAAGRSRRQAALLDRLVLFLVAAVWVLLYNNARVDVNVNAALGYTLLPIPREARVLEVLVVAMFFLAHQAALSRSKVRDVNAAVWLFAAIAVASVALAPGAVGSQVQGIYAYLAPFLLFLWAYASRPSWRLVRAIVWTFCAYLLVSFVVAVVRQYPVVLTRSDEIRGLFGEAHAFGALLAVGSCASFSRYLWKGGTVNLAASAMLFLVSYFPANEKMIVFNAAWLVGALVWRFLRQPASRRFFLVALFGVTALVGWAAENGRVDDWIRFTATREQPVASLGPIRAWQLAAGVLAESPIRIIVGVGPANFAGVAAMRIAAASDRVGSGLTSEATDVSNQDLGGVTWLTNTWSNLLAEFGIAGFLIFGAVFVRIAVPVYRWRAVDDWDQWTRLLCLALIGAVIWQGLFSPYTNWSDPLFAFPAMVFAARCHVAMARARRAERLTTRRSDPAAAEDRMTFPALNDADHS